MQELQDLQNLSLPEQLESNQVAKTALGTKFPMQLCAYSFELLMNFLQASKLFLILSIVNEHLSLQVNLKLVEQLLAITNFLVQEAGTY